jgi:glycolate oxidase FAD binding subunit
MTATILMEDKLRTLVGAEHVRSAGPEHAIAGLQPQFVVEPGTQQELAEVLRCADEAGMAVIPRGGGTKLEWGNPPKRADLLVSTKRLNRILEHAWADLTVTVEAGCILQTLQAALAQHGQRLAIDALWPGSATVGGVLSTNDSGVLRLRFGALRDLMIGVTLALPDGTLAASGGKVVKNVAGYDLPKLATGALGTLGIITRAVFRLHPLPSGSKSFSFATTSWDEMQECVLAIQDSKLAHTAFQIRCESASQPEADILFEATEAGLAAQSAQLRKQIGQRPAQQVPVSIWNARENLCNPTEGNEAIVKISVLPAEIAWMIKAIGQTANERNLRWRLCVQATGIAYVRLEGNATELRLIIQELREKTQLTGGSVVILHQPRGLERLDTWGDVGDALPLMGALKLQLDPHSTLNPGRFVGGI